MVVHFRRVEGDLSYYLGLEADGQLRQIFQSIQIHDQLRTSEVLGFTVLHLDRKEMNGFRSH